MVFILVVQLSILASCKSYFCLTFRTKVLGNLIQLYFHLKIPKNHTGCPIPIYARISVKVKRTEIPLNRKFEAERWCRKSERVNGNRESEKNLNKFMSSYFKNEPPPKKLLLLCHLSFLSHSNEFKRNLFRFLPYLIIRLIRSLWFIEYNI